LNKEQEFNDILDACLERLAQDDTPEQCLASYPDRVAELEPLLKTVGAVRSVTAITPRPEVRADGWEQASKVLRETRPRGDFLFFSIPRWAVTVSVFLVLLAAGSGIVVTAGSSMPDDFLYPVKFATERVQLELTTSGSDKTRLYAKLADRRVTELTNMAEKGKPDKIAMTAQRLDMLLVAIASPPMEAQPSMMEAPTSPTPAPASSEGTTPEPAPKLERNLKTERASEAASAPPTQAVGKDAEIAAAPLPPDKAELTALLRRYQTDHPEKLRAVLEKAPPSLTPLLERIIIRSQASYQQALRDLEAP